MVVVTGLSVTIAVCVVPAVPVVPVTMEVWVVPGVVAVAKVVVSVTMEVWVVPVVPVTIEV